MLKREEEVLTRQDPRHRYNINHTSEAEIRRFVAKLPKYHSGGVAGGGRMVSGEGTMKVELINRSSSPLQVTETVNERRGQQLVTQIFLDDFARNGPIRQTIAAGATL